jgi:hypothetical protein
MGEVVVWWVRLILAVILVGALVLAVAFFLLLCDVGADLRGFLASAVILSFCALLLLVLGMLVLRVGSRMSWWLRNWLSGQH